MRRSSVGRKTPLHKKKIRDEKEDRIDLFLLAFSLFVSFAVVLMVFSSWG